MNCIVCNQISEFEKPKQWALCGSDNWCLVETELAPIEPRWMDAGMNQFSVSLMRPFGTRHG